MVQGVELIDSHFLAIKFLIANWLPKGSDGAALPQQIVRPKVAPADIRKY